MVINPKNKYLAIFIFVIFSCEPETHITFERITKIILSLTPQNGGNTVNLTYNDIDGVGGIPAEITIDSLQSNTIYNGALILMDESVIPEINVTQIVEISPEDHQFFYFSNDSTLSIQYNDLDFYGHPIGLLSVLTTGEVDGTLRIVLRKYPDKGAMGVNFGDMTQASGTTELDINFPIVIR